MDEADRFSGQAWRVKIGNASLDRHSVPPHLCKPLIFSKKIHVFAFYLLSTKGGLWISRRTKQNEAANVGPDLVEQPPLPLRGGRKERQSRPDWNTMATYNLPGSGASLGRRESDMRVYWYAYPDDT